jgi:hypothetical protein
VNKKGHQQFLLVALFGTASILLRHSFPELIRLAPVAFSNYQDLNVVGVVAVDDPVLTDIDPPLAFFAPFKD